MLNIIFIQSLKKELAYIWKEENISFYKSIYFVQEAQLVHEHCKFAIPFSFSIWAF